MLNVNVKVRQKNFIQYIEYSNVAPDAKLPIPQNVENVAVKITRIDTDGNIESATSYLYPEWAESDVIFGYYVELHSGYISIRKGRLTQSAIDYDDYE